MSNWFVYIIHCSDNSLYTGIATDLQNRFQQHLEGSGAKYFRGRKPLKIVYQEISPDRSSASKRELEIKRLSRTKKLELINSLENQS